MYSIFLALLEKFDMILFVFTKRGWWQHGRTIHHYFAMIGGTMRYGIDQLIPNSPLPIATFSINLVGCFLLALLNTTWVVSERVPARLSLGLGTGLIGAFTTFSSFTLEILNLLIGHDWLIAGLYTLGSLVFGLAGSYLGVQAGHKLKKVSE